MFFFSLQKGIVCRRLRDRVAVKGANDRRGARVNRSNEASCGLGLVGLRECRAASAPAIVALHRR